MKEQILTVRIVSDHDLVKLRKELERLILGYSSKITHDSLFEVEVMEGE